MKTRKHFIRKYELLARCIQTNLEFLYYNSNAAIDSGKPVNAEPTTCSISIIVVCGTNV